MKRNNFLEFSHTLKSYLHTSDQGSVESLGDSVWDFHHLPTASQCIMFFVFFFVKCTCSPCSCRSRDRDRERRRSRDRSDRKRRSRSRDRRRSRSSERKSHRHRSRSKDRDKERDRDRERSSKDKGEECVLTSVNTRILNLNRKREQGNTSEWLCVCVFSQTVRRLRRGAALRKTSTRTVMQLPSRLHQKRNRWRQRRPPLPPPL